MLRTETANYHITSLWPFPTPQLPHSPSPRGLGGRLRHLVANLPPTYLPLFAPAILPNYLTPVLCRTLSPVPHLAAKELFLPFRLSFLLSPPSRHISHFTHARIRAYSCAFTHTHERTPTFTHTLISTYIQPTVRVHPHNTYPHTHHRQSSSHSIKHQFAPDNLTLLGKMFTPE